MSLKEVMAARAASGSTQGLAAAALGKSAVTTGAVNSKTAGAVTIAELEAARASLIAKPIKTSIDQVLFVCKNRPNLGSATDKNKLFKFKGGFLLTHDASIIEFIRRNAEVWGVEEDKTPVVEKKSASKIEGA